MLYDTMNRRRALRTLFCSSAALALNIRSQAEAAVSPKALHVLAIGDFGTGGSEQRKVAEAMADYVKAKKIKTEGIWFVGDNFYSAVYADVPAGAEVPKEKRKKSFTVKSSRWKTDIEDMYPASIFPGPQWAVLGNHDYHDNIGGEKIQLAYAAQPGVRWHMPSKWYRVDVGPVTFLAVDTNFPSVSGGTDRKTGKPKTHMSAKEEADQDKWLKTQLASPRGAFTVLVGHHPFYSNGSHRDSKPLIEKWGDLIQKHQVHVNLCGHDHDLQHLELEGKFTSFVLSGGGGARVRKLVNEERKMPYGLDVNGFTHLQIEPKALTLSHIGMDGQVLHRFTKKPDGKVIL